MTDSNASRNPADPTKGLLIILFPLMLMRPLDFSSGYSPYRKVAMPPTPADDPLMSGGTETPHSLQSICIALVGPASLKQLLWSLPVFLLLSFTAEDEVENEGVTALVVCPFDKPLLSEDDAIRTLAFDTSNQFESPPSPVLSQSPFQHLTSIAALFSGCIATTKDFRHRLVASQKVSIHELTMNFFE